MFRVFWLRPACRLVLLLSPRLLLRGEGDGEGQGEDASPWFPYREDERVLEHDYG